jgi:hypothetical protein
MGEADAKVALHRAYEIDSGHSDFLYALTDFHLKRDRIEKARYCSKQRVAKYFDQPIVQELFS